MKKRELKNVDCGVYTALITPFLSNGEIDLKTFERLVRFQITSGIHGLVIAGTTECSNLTFKEHKMLLQTAIEIRDSYPAEQKIPIIAGYYRSDSTAEDILLIRIDEQIGCDAVLSGVPCYNNKPTQTDLIRHFSEIANACPKFPIILYNAPSPTVVNLATETVLIIADEFENVIGIKHAGSLQQIKELTGILPKAFLVFSGNDEEFLEACCDLGADGVISVATNIIPDKILHILDEEDAILEKDLVEFYKILFSRTNPLMVKYILGHKLLKNKQIAVKNICRFPMLSEIDYKEEQHIAEVLKKLNIWE